MKQPNKTFRTPDEVAAQEEVMADLSSGVTASARDKQSVFHRLKIHFGKREWLASTAIVIICGGIVGFALMHTGNKPVASADKPASIAKTPKVTTVASTLSGLPVDPSLNERAVTGVMIENSTFARPQSGLSQANVVFEAIAEGGITRFLALFQDTAPDSVGPIRSARPYYEQWALGFDAGYAHVGGSPEALNDIKTWGVRDLDQFYNGGSYHRITTRVAPHNVYTSITTLNQLETSKGYATSKYTGFARKAEQPSKQPTARSIDFALSGPTYNVHYDYNAATNSYLRSEGGAAHMDATANVQISPKVVIGLVMPYSLESDGYHSSYNTIGGGPAYIYQDGTVVIGQWKKAANAAQFSFTDNTGKAIKLNPGQTWLTALSDTGKISSSP